MKKFDERLTLLFLHAVKLVSQKIILLQTVVKKYLNVLFSLT